MITLALSIFFLFYLVNYAEITRPASAWIKSCLHPKVVYAMQCGICLPFWVMFTGYVFFNAWGASTVLIVPVIHLFIDLVYQKLSGDCPPCIGGSK